jgi:hypothetical protein
MTTQLKEAADASEFFQRTMTEAEILPFVKGCGYSLEAEADDEAEYLIFKNTRPETDSEVDEIVRARIQGTCGTAVRSILGLGA